MKGFLLLIMFCFTFCIGMVAFAQIALPDPVSTSDFVTYLLQSLGGISGATTLAIIGVIVQILMKFVATPIFDNIGIDGSYKLLIVIGLTIVGGVVTLMTGPAGLTLVAALMHSTTLASIMVLIHQVYVQFFQSEPATVTQIK